MTSLLSSRFMILISRPVASASFWKTGMPRKTSGHQSSPMTSTFAGPFGFAMSALKAAMSSAGISGAGVVLLEALLVALDGGDVVGVGGALGEALGGDDGSLLDHGSSGSLVVVCSC